MNGRLFKVFAAGVLALTGASAEAALVSTATQGGQGTFSVSGSDLVNVGAPTLTSVTLTSGSALFASGIAAINEGTIYAGDSATTTTTDPRTFAPSEGSVLTFSLNTALNPNGYSLSSIATYTASGGAGPNQRRSGQFYDVAVSLVGNPTQFFPLYTVPANLANNNDAAVEVRVVTTQNAGDLMLSNNVSQVRFTFHNVNTAGDAESMFREIDLIGSVSAPPPPTIFASITSATGANNTNAVSGTDLINLGRPSLLSITQNAGTPQFGSSINSLIDGIVYAGSTSADFQNTVQTFAPSNGSVLTLMLDTSVNTAGYDIESIMSLTGSGASQTRIGQEYTLELSLVGDDGFIAVLGDGLHTVSRPTGLQAAEQRVVIAGISGQLLAANVDALRFTFFDTTNAQAVSMYREIDVIGTASALPPPIVPEPATAALGLVSLAGLLLRRRRAA